MLTKQEITDILCQMNGTTEYHRYSAVEWFPVITDGIMALAEAAGCYWLLDIIGSYQNNEKLDKHFQVWELRVNSDDTAAVFGFNDVELIITQEIPYTDFPLDNIKLYLIDGVILLPSEY